VEVRAKTGRAFGNGHKKSMKLRSFLRMLSTGNKDLYLSTQDAPEDSDGFPELLTVPLKGLVRKGLPLKPSVMSNLVPQAVNVWMGCSKDGSSSGLHHDFHDNLYVLLCGRKRFRLYPPSTARSMYTHGRVSKIHENGRCAATTGWISLFFTQLCIRKQMSIIGA
jgi:Cupin-like domain